MPPETDRATLWRELRSWPWYVQVGGAALAAAILGSSFVIAPLAAHDFPDRSEWPEGSLPERLAVGAVEEPDDASGTGRPEGVADYRGDPLWTIEIASQGDQAARIDQGVLHLSDKRIELERDGRTVWSREWDEYGAEIGVAGEVVVISERLAGLDDEAYEWPGRQDTVALDIGTGEEVWRDRDASFVSVFADAVVMTECTGKQEDHIGDCTLYVRDPLDRSLRWSAPTYASAQVDSSNHWTGEPLPDRLLVRSFPTGHESRTVTVYEDGRSLVSAATHGAASLAGDTLIVYDDYDDNPADGCSATLAGHRFGESAPAWQIEATTRKTADLAYCGGLPTGRALDGRLPLTIDGTPSIVDATTGETLWEAPAQGQAIALGPDTLVALDWESETDNLVAYDTATGEERWRATARFGPGDRAWTVESTLWLYGSSSMWGWSSTDVYAYDLDTGEGVVLPGAAAYFGPGEIVTTTGGDDAPVLSAWPADLW
ncbi:PQQ-binding-like beta-propeller repeat protein [Glycomyces sp. NRRL B-16210]|uniref:outer membrane protein assembly factor BamB family protein n=1 Tax=Glycomyces sp. NRRL B-16210 TaxID=1463821 RepID=UPI0004BF3ABB|nr:PQQ-binding-like beta-propeller repeat protein [Glycomyces sp. NRRL B-16210]